MGSPPTRDKVLRYLTEHQSQTVWLVDVTAHTGLTDKQAQHAVWALAKSGQHNIRTEARGRAWTYFGPVSTEDAASNLVQRLITEPESSSFEFATLAELPNAELLLKRQDGTIWRAHQL